MRNADYPKSQIYVYQFDVTEEDLLQTENFIKEKLETLSYCKDFKDDDIPECNEEERWADKTKWAVMKEGRKTAVKVCTDEEEAMALIAELGSKEEGGKHYVEERKGKDKKCERYCPCRDFCKYYKDHATDE